MIIKLFENKTFENILTDILASAPDGIDTSEGSIFYDAVAPMAMELEKLYCSAGDIIHELLPDTSSEEVLTRQAALLGIERHPASHAVIEGHVNIALEPGTRFELGNLTFTSGELIDTETHTKVYALTCDTPGPMPFTPSSRPLIPLSYNSEITSCYAPHLITDGTNEESLESFRKRVTDAYKGISYGGNCADYTSRAMKMSGVGGVKIYPAWNGGGTVKLVVSSPSGGAPSASVISDIKEAFDPTGSDGLGLGLAPIGHTVTVTAVTEKTIQLKASVTSSGSWSASTIKSRVEQAIRNYFSSLSVNWMKHDAITINFYRLAGSILDLERIDSIEDLQIYDSVSGEYITSDLTLGADEVPVLGEVTLE